MGTSELPLRGFHRGRKRETSLRLVILLDILVIALAARLDLLIGPIHYMAHFLVRQYGAAADFEVAKRIDLARGRGDGRGRLYFSNRFPNPQPN